MAEGRKGIAMGKLTIKHRLQISQMHRLAKRSSAKVQPLG